MSQLATSRDFSIFSKHFFGAWTFGHTNPPKIAGVLPPVLCAPFDDPDDFDDIAAGVPMLHGLRRRHVKLWKKAAGLFRGFVGDYTIQLCGGCSEPSYGSLLNNQYNGK